MNNRLRLRQIFCAAACALAVPPRAQAAFAIAAAAADTPEVVVPANPEAALPTPPPAGTRAHLYRMNYWLTSGFIVVGTAGNIYAIPRLIKGKAGISDAEIAAINGNLVPGVDRWILDQKLPADLKRPDKTSDYFLNGTIVAGALLGLDKRIRADALRLAMLYAETQVVTFCFYDFSPFGPAFQNKLRPVVYFDELPMNVRQEGNNRNSFYGGHVASTASATFCAAKILSDHHPEWSKGRHMMLYGLAIVPPLAVSYLRVRALKHFPSDCLVGLLIGGAIGVAVPELHRIKRQGIEVSAIGTPAGPGLSILWKPGEARK